MEKSTTREKNVGLNPVSRVKSSRYTIADSCDVCTLDRYIRMTCDDDLQALVIEGKPSNDVLEAARMKLLSEFAVLSGSTDKGIIVTKKIYLYRTLIIMYVISANLIASGDYSCIEMLNKNGLSCKEPKNEDEVNKLLKRIKSAITEKKVRMAEEEKRLARIQGKGDKPTRDGYMATLVAISKNAGFRIDTGITLAEYAAYLKDYKREVELMRQREYGKDGKKQ